MEKLHNKVYSKWWNLIMEPPADTLPSKARHSTMVCRYFTPDGASLFSMDSCTLVRSDINHPDQVVSYMINLHTRESGSGLKSTSFLDWKTHNKSNHQSDPQKMKTPLSTVNLWIFMRWYFPPYNENCNLIIGNVISFRSDRVTTRRLRYWT